MRRNRPNSTVPENRPATFKVLKKLRHNGKRYNPHPDSEYVKRHHLPDGTPLLKAVRVKGFKGEHANAPTEIPASELTDSDIEHLIAEGVIADPAAPKRDVLGEEHARLIAEAAPADEKESPVVEIGG
jgi:hypothetical protein